MYSHWHVLLSHIRLELHFVLFNLLLQLHDIWFTMTLASFLFCCLLKCLKFMSFVFFEQIFFGDKTLPIPIHLSQLFMNGYYWSSTGFKSRRVCLTIHGLSFKDIDFIRSETLSTRAKELLKINNTIETCFTKIFLGFWVVLIHENQSSCIRIFFVNYFFVFSVLNFVFLTASSSTIRLIFFKATETVFDLPISKSFTFVFKLFN